MHDWFENLTLKEKQDLGLFMTEAEWDTCASLSISACDFHRSRLKQRREVGGGDRRAKLCKDSGTLATEAPASREMCSNSEQAFVRN